MPNYKSGDIWSQYGKDGSVIFVTTCGVLTRTGLVMGAGIALEAKQREPKLPSQLMALIHEYRGYVDLGIAHYGVLFKPEWHIGAFQTKYHFKSDSSIEVIQYSTKQLKELAEFYPESQFHLNFPGIGLGRLNPNDIKPILSILPNNVTIWSK